VATILAATITGATLGACGENSSTAPTTNTVAASASASTPSTGASPPTPSPSTPRTSPTTPQTSPSTPGRPPKTGAEPPPGGESPPEGGQGSPAHGGRLLTRSQAAAFANAVTIQATDLRGFTIALSESERSAGEQRLERAILGCVGIMTGHSELAAADSKEFERRNTTEDLGVSSSVSVARTPAIAAQGLTAARSPNAQSCLSHYLYHWTGPNPKGGPSAPSLSVSHERALAPGTSGGVVLRIADSVNAGGKSSPLDLDFYGFVCGQAQIGLFTTSLLGAFPAAARQQLLALLLARAKANGECAVARSSGGSATFRQ
jgi:hypothetical protein